MFGCFWGGRKNVFFLGGGFFKLGQIWRRASLRTRGLHLVLRSPRLRVEASTSSRRHPQETRSSSKTQRVKKKSQIIEHRELISTQLMRRAAFITVFNCFFFPFHGQFWPKNSTRITIFEEEKKKNPHTAESVHQCVKMIYISAKR